MNKTSKADNWDFFKKEELPIETEEEILIKKKPAKPSKRKIKPKLELIPEKSKVLEYDKVLTVTIDDLRGIKHFAMGGTQDKTSSKIGISKELKKSLLDPRIFRNFLKNLTDYLDTI